MKLLKKITILLCFLSLIAFVSCSAEDKSGVKEKDNADGTEITGGGKSGNSGTGGTSETGGGAGTGEGSGTGGGTSGTGGGTETTEIGNFPPPNGTVYRDDWINKNFSSGDNDTKVSKLDENTTRITGLSRNKKDSGQRFCFDISKWKKTSKDGKDIKLESVDATDANDWGSQNISIVYYYDSSTLEITFKSKIDDCLFKGTKQP